MEWILFIFLGSSTSLMPTKLIVDIVITLICLLISSIGFFYLMLHTLIWSIWRPKQRQWTLSGSKLTTIAWCHVSRCVFDLFSPVLTTTLISDAPPKINLGNGYIYLHFVYIVLMENSFLFIFQYLLTILKMSWKIFFQCLEDIENQ